MKRSFLQLQAHPFHEVEKQNSRRQKNGRIVPNIRSSILLHNSPTDTDTLQKSAEACGYLFLRETENDCVFEKTQALHEFWSTKHAQNFHHKPTSGSFGITLGNDLPRHPKQLKSLHAHQFSPKIALSPHINKSFDNPKRRIPKLGFLHEIDQSQNEIPGNIRFVHSLPITFRRHTNFGNIFTKQAVVEWYQLYINYLP